MLPLLLIPPALWTAFALTPIRRPFAVATAGWVVGLPAQELPLHVGIYTAVATSVALAHGEVTTADLVGTGMAVVICAGLIALLARHVAAQRALDCAFEESARGESARQESARDEPVRAGGAGDTPTGRTARVSAGGTTTGSATRHRTPWLTALFQPWPLRPRGVEARKGLTYGPEPRANRFDLYTGRGRDRARTRGVLIHIHGGHFRAGGPSRESRAMLFDHALRGWAAISTTYHLSPTPEGGFPQHLVDVKRLIHWIRTEGPRVDIPADAPIVVAGSSAGAHIAMMTALTAGDPRYQPGFEHTDTTLAGAIGLYGYYGRLGAATKDVSDPVRHPAAGAPPMFVIHGTADVYTPVRGSRRLVRHLRSGSPNPVIYAELPGAQYGFDAVQSVRYLAVVTAIRRFTDSLVAGLSVDSTTADRPRRTLPRNRGPHAVDR
ncbi:alpha/beta hydrolase [Rhodococcus sp. IEGM 1408]|uniref:alpha/beta hydrolase n=1 Tax=Rhodococcus sp. IEGM 1408 TaxID=3082220 RepID=UPI002955D181|nr:alpha/beta hydrolase [Rhodococcus sp. IEGM 1408]MDV7999923.1 alpha/beta hydrolase [Rhodococcus sp. IEGM 1408]